MDRIDALKLFSLVAETESFSKAAEISRLPRSTVSAVIQKLESSHKTQLLYRTTRKVHLTEDGLALLQRCHYLLAEMDEIDSLFKQNPSKVSGKIKVDVPSRIGSRVIAPALPDFLNQFPEIDIELRVTDRAVDLIQEGVDCVLRVGNLVSSSLIARPVGRFDIINVASVAYLKKYGAPEKTEDLSNHFAVNYISPTTGKVMPWEYIKDNKLISITMKSRVMVNHADTYIACALSGMGMIQAPAFDVMHLLAKGELVEVLPHAKAEPMRVNILYPHRQHLSQRVRIFIDWLEKTINDIQH